MGRGGRQDCLWAGVRVLPHAWQHPWTRPDRILHLGQSWQREGCWGNGPVSWFQTPIENAPSAPHKDQSLRDRTGSTLAGTPTRLDSSHWLLGDSLVPLISLDITLYHDPKEFIFPHLNSSVSQGDWPEGSTLHSGMSFTYIYYHTIQQVTLVAFGHLTLILRPP